MDLKRTVLWSGAVGPGPVSERAELAADNGYQVMTVSPAEIRALTDDGVDPAEVRRICNGFGVDLLLDAVSEWYPHEAPKRVFSSGSVTSDEFLGMAAALGASTVTALAPFPTPLPIDGVTQHFADLCDRADALGIGVQLEFTPVPAVASLATAWNIVRDAGRPNAGIVFDTWHFFHGTPDFEVLQTVPGDRIWGVQVSDGSIGSYVEGLIKDTYRHRRLPGEGTFDLERALRGLDAIGGLRGVGSEVLSEELFALPMDRSIRAAADGFDRFAATLS